MYSAASITDFDSNDDDYPNYDGGISDSRSSNNSRNSSNDNVSASALKSCPEFGEFVDNYGWIQCRSKTYPDRVYYHNTRSGCNTWCRPVSRCIDIPSVTVRRANCTGDILESATDLELMSVSDDEKGSKPSGQVSASDHSDHNRSLIDVSDIIARYYYTPQMNPIPSNPSTDDSRTSSDEYASECYEKKDRADESDESDENNNVGDSKEVRSPLYAANFLETEFFVGKGVVNTEGTSRIFNSLLKENASNVPPFRANRVVYGMPRLKRISLECQLIKPRRTRVPKTREEPGPRKIISDMYGVRTISYDLPEPAQACAAMGVKTTTLSASDDSDESVPPSPSSKRMRSFESEYRDIAKNLRQPLLSESSSSPSSRSDTTSSSTSRSTNTSTSSSTSSSSCSCSCSSCSRET
ncbi:uncharacterized protein DDB_G0271670-like [Temnothorax curvispinosus]|uniref:Uncharacterized protein DDB_G0271670-like n=1 Tax=Temnothorax curvispinosus TaxID=300111 RepID=A0A6J1PM81_9HYME|nr:uncharacterized protein DDB_G0271670-like [Temnothorax curvispinosus]